MQRCAGGIVNLTTWDKSSPFRSIRLGTRDTGHLGPDPKSLSADTAMIYGIGVCGTAEEVRDLIMGDRNRWACPADLKHFMMRSRRRVG